MTATYLTLRYGMAAIAVVFPVFLIVGGLFSSVPMVPPVQTSLSAYYWAGAGFMRDWFVGILFGLGVCVYLYKGYSQGENIALNLAGICACGVAIVPVEPECIDVICFQFSWHSFFAIGFFLTIAYVAIFCAGNTLYLIEDAVVRARYRMIYYVLGALMLVAPAAAFLFGILLGPASFLILIAEIVAIYIFAAYWLVKSAEIRRTNSESQGLAGTLAR